MTFSVSIWGTVAQWFSAVTAGLAFCGTLWVISRDGRLRRREQATKIAYYIDTVPRKQSEVMARPGEILDTWATPTVRNGSGEPIYDVEFWSSNHGGEILSNSVVRKVGKLEKLLQTRPLPLLPEQTVELAQPKLAQRSFAIFIEVTFRDNAGQHWQRSLRGGLRRLRRTPPYSNSYLERLMDE